jgi:hypothetical protein
MDQSVDDEIRARLDATPLRDVPECHDLMTTVAAVAALPLDAVLALRWSELMTLLERLGTQADVARAIAQMRGHGGAEEP